MPRTLITNDAGAAADFAESIGGPLVYKPFFHVRGTVHGRTAAVYSDDSLITEVDGVHAEQADADGVSGAPTSSSTAPGLMADMLDALDVNEGDEVYEVGTGSGYNAALLCHLAGDAHATTVDRSESLAALARTRLSAVGFDPLVIRGGVASDFPPGATYDRIIATASVRRVPAGWLERCRPGGILVLPVSGTLAGGMLARLTKLPDGTAAGHILHSPAAFMPLKDLGAAPTGRCTCHAFRTGGGPRPRSPGGCWTTGRSRSSPNCTCRPPWSVRTA